MDNKEIEKIYVTFHGIKCLVSYKYDEKYYRLIAMDHDIEKIKKDKSFTEYHMWGAVARPITCPHCNKETWIDDTKIPNGAKFEISCDNCNAIIFIKK